MTTNNKSNIRLLIWDRYLINRQVKERISWFEKTYWENNVLKIYADDFDSKFAIENIRWWGLFATRKMIVIYDIPLAANRSIPAGNKEQIENFINYFTKNIDTIDPDSATLIFASSSPDKRTAFFKFVWDSKNNIKAQELKYSKSTLIDIIESNIWWRYEDSQKDMVYEFFEEYYKNDLYGLENNLLKLQNYDRRLDIKIIKQICYYNKEHDLFWLIESLLSPEINLEEKNDIINNIKDNDDNPFSFLGLFSWNIVSILNLIDGIKCWYTDYKLLMSKVKIHPFAFGKLYKEKNKLVENHQKIIDILDKVINLEYKIKTWLVPPEYFRWGFKEIMR